jgi:hypothetical protein
MMRLAGSDLWGARSISHAIGGDISILGLPLLTWIVLIALIASISVLVVMAVRKRKRQKTIANLQKQRLAMEKAEKDLFTERKADDIKQAVLQPGKPTTVLPGGAVAYSETGEMLVFKSDPAISDKDVVASAVGGREGRGRSNAPMTWSASYAIERIIVLHITGVAMFAVDTAAKVMNGRDLESDLLMVLERLLEKAKWLGGEMVTAVWRDRTVSLTWGEDIHMAAIVDGEPDERLDRELRWAIGDLVEEFADEIWSWGEETDSSVPRTLTKRLHDVFLLTAGVSPGDLAAQSEGGGIRVTSTVSWRHALAEYSVGILNNGPGPVHDIELLPSLSREGMLDVISVEGVDVDKDMKFRIDEIAQGAKAVATFMFRASDSISVRVDCAMVYRRGVAGVQQLQLPGRWIELDYINLINDEHVEPERALELAIQPASFRDRCALYIPRGMDPEALLNASIQILKEDFDAVVELEDDDMTQLEAWFHADVVGEGSVVTAVTVVPKAGIVDLFASSTVAGVVPGVMVLLRKSMDRTAKQHLTEVLDPEIRATVPKMGILLYQSWGFFED